LIQDASSRVLDRRYGIALSVRTTYEPFQARRDRKEKRDHSPEAEAQEASPETRDGFSLIGPAVFI
jgi:hypothetical protein